MGKLDAFIYAQWEETSGVQLAERKLRYQFEPDSNVMVKQMIDYVLKAMKVQKKETIEFMCEFEHAKHGYVYVDAESLVEEGVYKVRLHQQAHEKQQPKQQEQVEKIIKLKIFKQ
jgi:hypothetical protein